MMGRSFHLEINSLEDFAAFIAIIRGEETNLDEIKKITAQITTSDDALKDAVEKNK